MVKRCTRNCESAVLSEGGDCSGTDFGSSSSGAALPALPCPEAVHTCPAHKGYKNKHLLCIPISIRYLLRLVEEKNK
jgi:hypothetical protein